MSNPAKLSIDTHACLVLVWAFFQLGLPAVAQQILWARNYPLPQTDYIFCIAKDTLGNMYAGGSTYRNRILIGATAYDKAMVIKIDPQGDTIFAKDLGVQGRVHSIAVDLSGIVRMNITQEIVYNGSYHTLFLSMTPEGFIFDRDTLQSYFPPLACSIGKDSSLVVVGFMYKPGGGGTSMYFLRIQKDGTFDPMVELDPGHPNCRASRVEQLPNGHYLVSGYVGSRIASYELEEDGSNAVFTQWYQTPDLSNMSSGHVSRINGHRYMIGGEGGPCVVGQYDSLANKYWMRKDIGTQVPPQAIIDGSVLFGYVTSFGTNNSLFRVRSDSTEQWKIVIKDSLAARGINGVMQVKSFSYFEDESAVAAGVMYNGSNFQEDPIFIKIANVGTPVTSLSKPKKGPLQNETLAPWPNPSSGTLYLKQHFDKAEVRFYNLSGKEMGQYQIRFGQPIELSALPPGLYLYRAVIDGKSYSGKVVKR
jgi:hypothetical protein